MKGVAMVRGRFSVRPLHINSKKKFQTSLKFTKTKVSLNKQLSPPNFLPLKPMYGLMVAKWKFPIIHCNIRQNVSKLDRNDVFDRTAPLNLKVLLKS